MKRIVLSSILLLLFLTKTEAQQDALYSQYMFNQFVINPAYAGSRETFSSILIFREQWLGIEGAPSTQSLAIHSPAGKQKLAWGLNLFNEVTGPTQNNGLFGTVAYHLPLSKGKLSFGLRGGMYSSQLDASLLNFMDPNDRFNGQGTARSVKPGVDFGMYYYTHVFYAGFSATHLNSARFNFSNLPDNAEVKLDRHYFLTTGAALKIGENTVFKPSTLVRYVPGAPVNFDLNASFLFNKTLWLGTSVRTQGSVMLMTEVNIKEFLRIGYSYDLLINRLKYYSGGSHELMLGIDLNLNKTRSISPRYM